MRRLQKCWMLTAIFVAVSCSSGGDTEKLESFDFGGGKYREPFSGLLKSRPELLEKSLQYPPFKWCAPDTLKLHKTLLVGFNDESIRSKSKALIMFADSLGRRIQGLAFICDGQKLRDNVMSVSATEQQLRLDFTVVVSPLIGERHIGGFVYVAGQELDEVNGISIQQEQNLVAQWGCSQKISWPFWLWLLWLLALLIVLVVVALALYGLGYGLYKLAQIILYNTPQIAPSANSRPKNNYRIPTAESESKSEPERKKGKSDRILQYILSLQDRLYRKDIRVADKYDILEEMRLKFDELFLSDHAEYEKCKNAVSPNTWDALEDAWTLWNPVPTSNVEKEDVDEQHWEYTLLPSNNYYSECTKVGFVSCVYDIHGSPDFGDVSEKELIVDVTDLYDGMSVDALDKRGGGKNSFQEIAQRRMAERMAALLKEWWRGQGLDIKDFDLEVAFYKWRDSKDLVPHEDTNCRTMRLVYRPAHKAFRHRGGIANAKNIKKHFG